MIEGRSLSEILITLALLYISFGGICYVSKRFIEFRAQKNKPTITKDELMNIPIYCFVNIFSKPEAVLLQFVIISCYTCYEFYKP